MSTKRFFRAWPLMMALAVIIPGVGIVAATAEKIEVGKVRELLQRIAGANFSREQVQIKKISGGIGGDVIVEAQIETAYRLTKVKDDWRIAEIRLGDRHWESFELIEEAVRREKTRRTLNLIEELAGGLTAYQKASGQFVAGDNISQLLDAISPRYISTPHRFDLWGTPFEYQGNAGGYRLRSAGPDRKSGTPDDLVTEGGAFSRQTK